MNDRFRFRIWCKDKKTYWHQKVIEETTLFVLARLNKEKNIVEQCTGLKDNNGNLIYEGDVVEAVVQNHYKLKGVICWEIDRYQIKELNAPVLFDLYEALYDSDTGFAKNSIEVIGNIHENPELLEK